MSGDRPPLAYYEATPAVGVDRSWADRFTPDVAAICGRHLYRMAPPDKDCLENTDLVTVTLGNPLISIRVRRHHFLATFPGEITLRSERYNGRTTELMKVAAGLGDYLVYGFATEDETALEAWVLGDLRVFREWFVTRLVKDGGTVPGQAVANFDGSSGFRAFRLADLPPNFVVANSPGHPGLKTRGAK